MENQLDFYEVCADYIKYLRKFDSKVPRISYTQTGQHNKFMCGIVMSINNHNYFAPISSFATPQRTNVVITNESNKPISSIRFSFMIPVPPGAISLKKIKDEPCPKYRRLLDLELRFCRKNSKKIHRIAKYVYNTVINDWDSVMVKNSCNFKELEAACAKYK